MYDATGTKLKKTVSTGTQTEYCGNYVYKNNNLVQFSTPEGYVEPKGNDWQYVYRYADMWGNTRVTYADDNNDGNIDASSEIRREQNYYPFGLEHKGYNKVLNGVKNNLKTYQGQEFTEDLGLNTHEWKYRVSDPAIGRFWQVDPLAEDYMYNSTYAFQENKMGMGVELEGAELLEWAYETANSALNYLDANYSDNSTVQRYVGAMRTGLAMTPQGMVEGYVESASGSVQKIQNGDVTGMLELVAPVGKNLVDAGKTVQAAANGDEQAQGAVAMMVATVVLSKGAGRAPKTTATTPRGTTGMLNKQPRGKGSVEPSKRPKPRMPSKREQRAQYEKDQGKCQNCGNDTPYDQTTQHHYPDRHADGGSKTVTTCKECHENYLHKKD